MNSSAQTGSSGRKQFDHLIKLIIIGDSSVGKSCILLRFSEDNFPMSHMPTIGKYYYTEHADFRHPGAKREAPEGQSDRKTEEQLVNFLAYSSKM